MLGTFLKVARKRRGLSQGALAQRAGITPSYLSDIERNGLIPSRKVLHALAQGLGLPASLLVALLYPLDAVVVREEAVLAVESS